MFCFFSNPVLLCHRKIHFLGLDQENHVIPFIKLPSFCIFGIIQILSTCRRGKKKLCTCENIEIEFSDGALWEM